MNATWRNRSGPGRLMGLAGVVALHIAALYAFATGMGQRTVEVLRSPLENLVVAEIRPPQPPKIAPPKVEVPPPSKIVAKPPPAAPKPRQPAPVSRPVAAVTPSPLAAPSLPPVAAPPAVAAIAPAPAVPQPVRTAAGLDKGHPCTPPRYPAASRRAEETGTVELKFLIDTDGSVVESTVSASSGFERLDEAARDALARCRFSPGTVDGRPERSWARIRYIWKLQ